MRYRGGQHHDAKRAIAQAATALLPADVALGRAQRRHDDDRGRPRAGRAAGPAGRHQRAEHRLRAGRAVEHRAGRLRRQRPRGVLRAGRPAGRADPVQHQPRRRHHRRRRRAARRPASPPTTRSRRTPTGRWCGPPSGSSSWPTRARSASAGSPRSATSPTASDIVTDSGAAAEDVAELRRLGPEVHVVELPLTRRGRSGGAQASGSRSGSGSRSPWAATMSSASRQMSSTAQRRGGVRVDHHRLPDQLGAPSTAARTVRSTTDRNCRLSAAHCGGRSPTATGRGAGSVDDDRGLRRRRRPAGWRSGRRWRR